jgi:hypothetical protein
LSGESFKDLFKKIQAKRHNHAGSHTKNLQAWEENTTIFSPFAKKPTAKPTEGDQESAIRSLWIYFSLSILF